MILWNCLKQEIQKVTRYYEHLKARNSLLKARKQEVIYLFLLMNQCSFFSLFHLLLFDAVGFLNLFYFNYIINLCFMLKNITAKHGFY
jgi:hypothetical protein